MPKFLFALMALTFISLGTLARPVNGKGTLSNSKSNVRKEASRKKSVATKRKTAKKTSKKVSSKNSRSVKAKKSTRSRKSLAVMDPFTRNMGSLVWPIEEGNIKTGFGPYKVGLGTVTGNNPGLTIEASKDAEVMSAFDGVVTRVFEIEGNKAVVVRHGNYLTVYGNLASINVSLDDKINAGDAIGKAANNEEGNGEIEFLLMRKNQNIDPEPWMKRK